MPSVFIRYKEDKAPVIVFTSQCSISLSGVSSYSWSSVLPSTSMLALVKETEHLYRNAFEIITHGLNLKRSNDSKNGILGSFNCFISISRGIR
ncbi:MAG: hypothetical protein B7C24_17665 [Bacteroidetes bacterium 4572_77]|nr:MAG: hypothetical protein B7C24_17665 [Bacteroidetes bacterium 4572_77]